jgi:MFS family permease
MTIIMVSSIIGNFLAAAMARRLGYRRSIALLCIIYFVAMTATYGVARDRYEMMWCLPFMGASAGLFALFTMYMPPLFPTLLRTTGAGFCYNIGRIAAAVGTVVFGFFSSVGDYRLVLLYAGTLFIPAAVAALFMPEPPDERSSVAPVD